ncbi:MAG: alpha/beta fold hydrolase [Ignavibacteriales bacterium]|nr:alpha/beta fold hydrolase [Ignavibacteriales bacterium]
MRTQAYSLLTAAVVFATTWSFAQPTRDTIVFRDIELDKDSPARMVELNIPSGNSLIQGFVYKANGGQKHPTLLLLHGYPGNERHLDLAQAVRTHGWNVIYFDYRGSWGSQGQFSFANSVEDVANVVRYCGRYQDSLQIDTSRIALFGHSMGGWVCLKALAQLPSVKKGFALSVWNIYDDFKNMKNTSQIDTLADEYFVLNTHAKDIYRPVIQHLAYYNLVNDVKAMSDKQIAMLDEHPYNKEIADSLRASNRSYFEYQVWKTDHAFTNRRASLMNFLIAFLDR